MTSVRRAVGRQHARSHDPPRGESRILDGERGRLTHDLHCGVSADDEPRVERRHPANRRDRPQPGEMRMRIGSEFLDRDHGVDATQQISEGLLVNNSSPSSTRHCAGLEIDLDLSRRLSMALAYCM